MSAEGNGGLQPGTTPGPHPLSHRLPRRCPPQPGGAIWPHLMRMIAGALSLSGDLFALDKDGTLIELDAMWIRRATWWEDAIETASGITALGAAIAERVGHDR